MRDLIERLKRVDERQAPAFEEVLERPARMSERRPAGRLRLAVVGCLAVLLIGFSFLRWRQDAPTLESAPGAPDDVASARPPDMPPTGEHDVDIDFDHLRQVVESRFSAATTTNGRATPVWSSRTESLLALNLNVSVSHDSVSHDEE